MLAAAERRLARASWPACWRSAPTTAPRGDATRDVCLIPASAHGTNAASAVMAGHAGRGRRAATTATIDVADLRAKLAEHAGRVAAIMLTYPSTHGVFEETITEVCDLVHDAGGQVYIDGANLNALVGVAGPVASAPTSPT